MEQEHIDDIIMDIQLQTQTPSPHEPEDASSAIDHIDQASESSTDPAPPTQENSEEIPASPIQEDSEENPAQESEPIQEPSDEEKTKPAWVSFFTPANLRLLLIGAAVLLITALTLSLRCYRITLNDQHWIRLSLSGNAERVVRNSGVDIKDNHVIEVEHPSPLAPLVTVHTDFDVTMQADGTTQTKRLAAGTDRAGVLDAFGIVMDEDDRFSMADDERLSKHCMVTVNRVEVKTETYEEPIGCPVQDLTQPELGTQTLASPGREGIRRVTGIRTYVDGVITDVVELESEILRHPTTTVLYSEQPIPGAGNGKPEDYTKVLTCQSTAYCLRGTTASGQKTQKGYVAVDPSVIPLGTWLYIESLTPGMEDYGYCIAADTGSAIVGNMVDVYFYTEDECRVWGRRDINVYVLG